MNAHEEKIIIRPSIGSITDIQTLLSEGWRIKFSPTVIPAFEGKRQKIIQKVIYVLERDQEYENNN